MKYEIRHVTRRTTSFIYEATDAEHAERMFMNGDRCYDEKESSEGYSLPARRVGEHGRPMVPAVRHIDGDPTNNEARNQSNER